MIYEANAYDFVKIVKGSTPLNDQVDCCIYPESHSIRIVTYSSDLSTCTSTEIICDVKNYRKTSRFLFPVFEFINRTKTRNEIPTKLIVQIFQKYVEFILSYEDYSIKFKKQVGDSVPVIFNYIPTIPHTEFCSRIKKDTFLKILDGCDEEDILEFNKDKENTIIGIINPYTWDTIVYNTSICSNPPEKETSFLMKNILNYVKYIASHNLKIWLSGNGTPIILKTVNENFESTLYISPYVHTREEMDTEGIIKDTLNDIINDI